MLPTGNFSRLRCDVIERYKDSGIPVTFGILIVDYRQTLAREYILNYMSVFNKKSNKYIDFFVPGYVPFGTGRETGMKDRDGNIYNFSTDVFFDFIEKFETTFGFKYDYNPALILVEFDDKDFNRTKKIIINLDSQEGEIKRTGVLFEKIFDFAKSHVELSEFSHNLVTTYMKGTWVDSVISAIGSSLLSEINTQQRNIRRFILK